MSKFLAVVLCFAASLTLFAGDKSTNGAAKIVPGSKVYIEKMNGFETYLEAAFTKKKVQLTMVADETQADYVITGFGQDYRDNSASITMIDKKTTVILFAYAVNKKNTVHSDQTTAEACAKHLEAHIESHE
jgi:hypothetical protein